MKYGLARVGIWKFKVDPFQAMMVPNGVYVPFFQHPTQRMFGLKRELKYYLSPTVVQDGALDLKYHILKLPSVYLVSKYCLFPVVEVKMTKP